MKKVVNRAWYAVVALCLCGIITGCGDSRPTKPGGGGQQQPYKPDNGQYDK